MNLASADEKERYEHQGYLMIRSIFSPEELKPLVAAADRYFNNCFLKKGTYGRKTMHDPELEGLYEPELFNCIATPRILGLSEELKGCKLRATYYDLNMENPGKDTSMRWHRDLQFLPKNLPPDFDCDSWHEETPFSQIQWNVALVDDAVLQIVPESHCRIPTEQQQVILDKGGQYDPSMPGSMSVDLKPGDGVAYHSNLIHGVCNPTGKKRRTIHWYWVGREQYDPFLGEKELPASLIPHLNPTIKEMSDPAFFSNRNNTTFTLKDSP